MDEAYLRILQMIQDGVITAEEGEELLIALEGQPRPGESQEAAVVITAPPEDQALAGGVTAGEAGKTPVGPPGRWRQVWVYPLAGGFVLLALGGFLTGNLIQGGHRLGWLACTIPLLLFGALVALLAWWSRSARWLHLYVREEGKEIKFSFPLPLRLTAWMLRLIRPWVPKLRETAVDELILSLAESDVPGSVLTVEVNDEEDDEEVRVYIG